MPTMYLKRPQEITVLYCKVLTRYKSKGLNIEEARKTQRVMDGCHNSSTRM